MVDPFLKGILVYTAVHPVVHTAVQQPLEKQMFTVFESLLLYKRVHLSLKWSSTEPAATHFELNSNRGALAIPVDAKTWPEVEPASAAMPMPTVDAPSRPG